MHVLSIIIILHYPAKCLRNRAGDKLPVLRDFNRNEFTNRIILHHQAIIQNFRFHCCGNITEWGADVFRGRGDQHDKYTIDFQVWRRSPTVNKFTGAGQYRLVGNNRFTSLSLLRSDNYLIKVTPSPQDYIQFQPGDVLGFYVDGNVGDNDGVVLDSTGKFNDEFVWQANIRPAIAANRTVYSVGRNGDLNSSLSGVPVISVNSERKLDNKLF